MTVEPDTAVSAAVHIIATSTALGCTADDCGSPTTVQLHPNHGRLCPVHAVHPSGRYRPGFAEDLTDAGRPDLAFRYLRTWIGRQCDIRFAGARVRLALREELTVSVEIVPDVTRFKAAIQLAQQLAVR